MKLYDVTLLHAGNQLSTIRKRKVTVAEIAVLRLVHGMDAVREITEAGSDRRPGAWEMQRLRQTYAVINGDDPHPVDTLWPGVNPQLPDDLAAIGIKPDHPFIGAPPKPLPDADEATNYRSGWTDIDLVQGEPDLDDIDAMLGHPKPGATKAA